MTHLQRRAAAWAAPLMPIAGRQPAKQTHKLRSLDCVLWIPAKGAYVGTADILHGKFTTTADPSNAMRFSEDAAEVACLYLARQVGLSVALRTYNAALSGVSCKHS